MNTLFIGHNLIVLESVSSTNDFCIQSLEQELPEGTVVYAKQQTAGKGQRGKKWHSNNGDSLTFSIVFYPENDVSDQFVINKAISVALCESLKGLGLNAKIKWPNDIYVNNRKLSGILIENSLRGAKIQYCIVGVGINVNQLKFNSALPNPISIRNLLGVKIDINTLLADLCYNIERRYLQFRAGFFSKINTDYNNLLYRKGEEHQFLIAGRLVKGQVEGVDQLGKIKLLTIEGEEAYANGEIEFII